MVMTSDLRETLHRLPHTLRVGDVPGGLCEYLSIQAAINYAATVASAANPWTISIYPGLYDEQIACAPWVNLRGIGTRGSAIIQQTDARVIILADNVELKNLTVRLVTPTVARQLVYDNAAACTATLEDINFEITTPLALNHALMRFYGAGVYTVRGCFANIGAAGATFYTIEHDQNAGTVHLFNNDFTAATGYHIRSGVAGTITGGQNRWAGACGLFNTATGSITLDEVAHNITV
jgi:hypothetical protein